MEAQGEDRRKEGKERRREGGKEGGKKKERMAVGQPWPPELRG